MNQFANSLLVKRKLKLATKKEVLELEFEIIHRQACDALIEISPRGKNENDTSSKSTIKKT